MQYMLTVFTDNILPVFFLIMLGFLLGKKVKLDPSVLTSLNFYIIIPSFMFVMLTETDLPANVALILVAATIMLVINALLGLLISKARSFDNVMSRSFASSLMFYNSGNIGIPLITLVFSDHQNKSALGIALAVQISVLLVQNISINTVGFILANHRSGSLKESIVKVFKMPIIYSIALALCLKYFSFDPQSLSIWPALVYAKDAMVAIALLTLGIQLASTSIKSLRADVFLSSALRLVGGPIAALIIIWFMRFDGIVAQAFLISSSVPTAVNTALIAIECKTNPEFASQTVMVSTVISAIILSGVIFLSQILY
ncbi:MAG: AEC family transporter [Eubacteriales bacterium]|nr:AEC family transporter [Eubacteriales bacterium]